MRRLLVLLAALALSAPAAAANRYAARSGGWDSGRTWSGTGCSGTDSVAVPTSADAVYLCPTTTVYLGCGVAAAAASIQDEVGAAWQAGAGLVADGSRCAQGQVPSITLHGTGGNDGIQLASLGPAGTFTLKGRRVFADLPWGQPSDLTAGTCGTVNGITWPNGSCATYTWANQPYAAQVGTLNGTAGVAAGDVIWLSSGQWRNNFLVVISATSNTITVGYGDPGDDKGAAGGFSPSLQAARDTSLTAWDETNPTRVLATVSAGTLPGTGELQGSCLVTSNGSFYRIAGSIDGGAGTDTLVMDPWATVQLPDKDSTYLATANNAWIAPCIKPGDRFDAWDPVEIRPASAGTSRTGLSFFSGACPVLEGVYLPNVTQLDDLGASVLGGVTDDMVGGWMHFYGNGACTVNGPVMAGPLRDINSNPYGPVIKSSNGLVLSKISLQGFYAQGGVGPVNGRVAHGFTFFDSPDLTIRDSNISFINNEAYYLREPGAETSETDQPFEGARVVMERVSAHDIFTTATETDGLAAISLSSRTHTTGEYQFTVKDALVWNTETGLYAAHNTAVAGNYARILDSVIGYEHRIAQADAATRLSIQCQGEASNTFNEANVDVVNNVAPTAIHYASNGFSVGIGGCKRVYYSYVGEHYQGIDYGTGALTSGRIFGTIVDNAGASATSQGTMQRMVEYQRDTGYTDQVIRDLYLKRQCSVFAGVRTRGLNIAQTTANAGFSIDWSHITAERWCPTAASLVCGDSFCNAIEMTNVTNIGPSSVTDVLALTGDPTQGSDAYEAFPILSTGSAVGGPLTINRVLCSECTFGATTCQAACCRNCTGSGITVGTAMRELNAGSAALGTCSETDMRLRRESPAWATGEGGSVIGARYAGVFRYSSAMQAMDVPLDYIRYRPSSDFTPDLNVVPEWAR